MILCTLILYTVIGEGDTDSSTSTSIRGRNFLRKWPKRYMGWLIFFFLLCKYELHIIKIPSNYVSYISVVKCTDTTGREGLENAGYGERTASKGKRCKRCNECAGCKQEDCGTCENCKDMRKFGGLGRKK